MRKTLTKRKIVYWVVFVILFAYALSVLTPFYFLINNSLKAPLEFYEGKPWALPTKLYFENYKKVFELTASGGVLFVQMIVNSVIFTAAATAISVASATVAAYILARFRFRGRGILVAVAVGAIVIPDLGSTSTVYKLFLDLGIMDTWFTLIRYITPFGMGFLIIYSAFKTVPDSYSEAAQLDGASDMRVFLTVCLPIVKGTIGAIVVIVAINCWNDYYTPYMYMNSIKMLSVGLQEMASTISQFNRTALFAGMVIAIAPLIVVFILMRDTIIQNTAAGGLKE